MPGVYKFETTTLSHVLCIKRASYCERAVLAEHVIRTQIHSRKYCSLCLDVKASSRKCRCRVLSIHGASPRSRGLGTSSLEVAWRSTNSCSSCPADQPNMLQRVLGSGILFATRSPSSSIFLANHIARLRNYATQTSIGTIRPSEQPRRRAVTPFNDDGRVPWGQLSPAEKVARTAQQSFNFTLIACGFAAAVVVVTLLYTDVFSPSSHISQYNYAVDRIKRDQKCQELLGSGRSISALGPPTGTSWIRQRPKAQVETDKFGTERMKMQIKLKGDKGEGILDIYMVRRVDENKWGWGHLFLDVPGQERLWLEKPGGEAKKKEPGTFMGIKWR